LPGRTAVVPMKRFDHFNGPYWNCIWRRAALRSILTMFPVAVLFIGLVFVDPARPIIDAIDEYFWYVLCPAVYALYCWRDLRRIKRLKYRVCFACNYELGELPERGRCPECGVLYDVAAVRNEFEH
jgi:hypothetical protein